MAGRFKSSVSYSLDHLTAVSGVGSSPALATCETSPVFALPTDWPVSYELKEFSQWVKHLGWAIITTTHS